jgi:uncharacterized protein
MIPLLARHRAQIEAVCRRYQVARLAVFGSAATDTFDPATSDIDLLVTFAPMPPVEHANAYFGLLEALESLFGREIDLVEEAAIKNPYFRRTIEGSRVALYAA